MIIHPITKEALRQYLKRVLRVSLGYLNLYLTGEPPSPLVWVNVFPPSSQVP